MASDNPGIALADTGVGRETDPLPPGGLTRPIRVDTPSGAGAVITEERPDWGDGDGEGSCHKYLWRATSDFLPCTQACGDRTNWTSSRHGHSEQRAAGATGAAAVPPSGAGSSRPARVAASWFLVPVSASAGSCTGFRPGSAREAVRATRHSAPTRAGAQRETGAGGGTRCNQGCGTREDLRYLRGPS